MIEHTLWINNQWTASANPGWHEITDPASGRVIGRVPAGDTADVATAVAAARDAFESWQWTPAATRADLLHTAAQRLRGTAESAGETLTLETGRLQVRNRLYIEWAAQFFDYYAELARNEIGRIPPSAEPDAQVNLVLKVPYGVVGCIVPFNYPVLLLAWKLAPALAAGNTAVIKPAPQTPLATLELMEAAFSHFPPGVINVVTGGADVGAALVAHPNVDVIAFTGSVPTGQAIMRHAADGLKPVHLELGGNDPAIVCADADFDKAVRAVAWGGYLNGGQVCTSIERVYVERPIYDRFCAALAAFSKQLVYGAGSDPETQVTPLISAAARERVHALVSEAVAGGAQLLCGGTIPERPGFFYPPTVLRDCTHALRLMREETFGPVMGVMPFDSFDEALALANDSEFALAGSIFTFDARRVRRFYAEVAGGTLWVNDPIVDNPAAPFGGMKRSGIGRELGPEGLEAFRQTKHVHWDFEMREKSWWF